MANAGIQGVMAPIEDLTVTEWDQVQSGNLRRMFLIVKHSIPHLRSAGAGSIVIISSVNGTRIFSNFGASCYSA